MECRNAKECCLSKCRMFSLLLISFLSLLKPFLTVSDKLKVYFAFRKLTLNGIRPMTPLPHHLLLKTPRKTGNSQSNVALVLAGHLKHRPRCQ